MELICKVQNYDWGKKGSNSKVATLIKNVNSDFELNENVPYAELWMGTHINAPSVVKESGETLSALISKHPEYLGEKVTKIFNNELPFLFKVLSVGKALSIQAHPSKKHAEELHAKYPHIYKDPNHKPELAVALTPFEALCGFRPVEEVRRFIKEIPELISIIEDYQYIEDDELFLRKTFFSILACDEVIRADVIDGIIKRFETLDDVQRTFYLADLVVRLNEQFPYDNGILLVYLLNYMQLEPGEGIYLGANEPHAYLFGDCIENMACSDNVVRAGLTTKFIDVDTLCEMLIYKGESPANKIFKTTFDDQYTKLYRPPVKDFAVAGIQIPSSVKSYQILKREGASILIVISGSSKYNGSVRSVTGTLLPGRTLFVPAHEVLEVSDITEDLLIYQAFANVVD